MFNLSFLAIFISKVLGLPNILSIMCSTVDYFSE